MEAVEAPFFRQARMRLDEKGLHLDSFWTRQWLVGSGFGPSRVG